MTTAAPSTVLATIQPVFTDAERVALAGFLAGYRGLTREAYALDLRQFTNWCRVRSLALFAVRRADIESFASELEVTGRARATVTRRLSTIAGFYKYAVEEELLGRSPAAHVRRPGVDLAIGERTDGPLFLAADGRRLDRHGAGRVVRATARRAGIAKIVTPHTLRHAFITAALDAGVPLRDVQEARLACRSADHDEVRPAPRQPGPARDLHRRRLPRRCRPVRYAGWKLRLAVATARAELPTAGNSNHRAVVTYCDLDTNANRRSACSTCV
jgi:hypothetical protein